MVALMMRGVSARWGGSCWRAALKWSDWTCAPPASPSRNASTRTYSFGSSRLRDQSNQRQPGSARVAWVNSAVIEGHASASSGLTRNLAVMKIMALPGRVMASVSLLAVSTPHKRDTRRNPRERENPPMVVFVRDLPEHGQWWRHDLMEGNGDDSRGGRRGLHERASASVRDRVPHAQQCHRGRGPGPGGLAEMADV